MLDTLKRGWWLMVLRGVCAVLFGVLAFASPGAAGQVLVIFFGAYALANGAFTLGLGLRAPKGVPGKGTMIGLGLLGVLAGLVTFFYPGVTALSLLWVIAFWAIFTGIAEIMAAVALRKELTNEWVLITGGILSVLFGAIVIARPSAGALSVVWLIATYAIIYGAMILTVSFKLRGLASAAREKLA
jgi:uncharacterized membrane protein HdeD (DUF308 family)